MVEKRPVRSQRERTFGIEYDMSARRNDPHWNWETSPFLAPMDEIKRAEFEQDLRARPAAGSNGPSRRTFAASEPRHDGPDAEQADFEAKARQEVRLRSRAANLLSVQARQA